MLGPSDLEECFEVMDRHQAEPHGRAAFQAEGGRRPLLQTLTQASVLMTTFPLTTPALLTEAMMRRAAGVRK